MSPSTVQSLTYRLTCGSGIAYTNPPPIQFATKLGEFRLADDVLSVQMIEAFTTLPEARQAVETFLRAWQVDADLTSNPRSLSFSFQGATWSTARGGMLPSVTCSATAIVTNPVVQKRRYPPPPDGFQANPDVDAGYRRWLAYHEGREPLASAAYFVLTLLEAAAGNSRKKAAKKFNISYAVLTKLARLVSAHGDALTARKANSQGPLTPDEVSWIERAMRAIIRRLGSAADANDLQQLSSNDLSDE